MEPDKSFSPNAASSEAKTSTGKLDGLSCCIRFKSSWLGFPEAIGGWDLVP